MGRAKRKKRIPEVLRDLESEDIPEGYGDFWHGSSEIRVPPVSALASQLSMERIEEIRGHHLSHQEQRELFAEIHTSISMENFSPQDPLVQALWQGERKAFVQALESMGAEKTLEIFLEKEEGCRQRWTYALEKSYKQGLEDIKTGNRKLEYVSIQVSLFNQIMSVDQNTTDTIRSEMEEKIVPWSERDPEGFRRFLTHIVFPGMAERHLRSEELFPRGRECARAAGEALAGPDLWKKIEKGVDDIRASGYFESGMEEEDIWFIPLERIGSSLLFFNEIESRESWNEDYYYNEAIRKILNRYTRDLAFYRKRVKQFLDSEIGSQLRSVIETYRGTNSSYNAEKEIKRIAKDFDSEISQKVISGEINIFEAWLLAYKKAQRRKTSSN